MNMQTPEARIKNFERKQYLLSGLFLIIFCGLSVILNTLHLQSVAEESTRFLSRMVEIGDFREASLVLQQAHLANFKTIHYQSSQPGRSFFLPPKAELFHDDDAWTSILFDKITVPVAIQISSEKPDKIMFEFERFRLVPYAILIWLILNLVSIPQTRFIKKRLIEQFHKDLDIEKKLVKNELSHQVRHNLRTPLAALMRIPKRLPDSVARDRELLEVTIRQIQDLIAKLDEPPKNSMLNNCTSYIYDTLLKARDEINLVIPKPVQFQFEIDDMISSTLINHIPFELRSIIGNLVNNSLEALEGSGRILVQAKDLGAEIKIYVSDTGKGIEPAILSRIFEIHFSNGKSNGSGVGLAHAKEHIESWGGSIHVDSTLKVGTTMTISLPVHDRAPWYLPRLKFNSESRIYVLDDQKSAQALWRLRLEEANLLEQSEFLDVDAISATLYPPKSPELSTFLFDYDLGLEKSGLHLLAQLPKASTKCLVTGHFDDEEVRSACTNMEIFLIPKSQIKDIPIVLSPTSL